MDTYYFSKNTKQSGLNPYNKAVSVAKEKKPSVGEKILHTTGDIFANIISGASKGLEGIVDLGAGIGGAIAGIFDKNAQNDVKNFMSRDLTGELFANKWQDDLKYSYLNDGKVGRFAEKTLNAVGQMLPAVVVGLVTGGAGAAASVSQAASLATMGASAAGTSTEEAYNEGADYYKGLGYGVASGAVEMATEKMTGGALKGVIGKGMFDGAGKVAATGAKRVLKNAVEEGAEEVVSELANPALKSIYKGKEAFDEYGDADYWKGVAEAGLVGGATSVVYGGTVGKVLAKSGYGYTGKDADVAESVEKVRELENERNELWADGKLTAEENTKINEYVERNNANIESVLKKTSTDKRGKLIREFNLESRFDENGNQTGLQSNAESSKYLSPRIDRKRVATDLRAMSTELNSEMSIYNGELSAKGEQSYKKFKKAVNALNRLSGVDVGVAVLSPNPSARYNGSIINNNIYISADNFEDKTWAETLVHEYTHFAEGTAAYNNLVAYLSSDKNLSMDAIEEFIDRGYADNVGSDIDYRESEEYNLSADEKRFSKKTPYSQYRTVAKIWAHETSTKIGDMKEIYNPKTGKFDTIVADGSDEGYHIVVSKRFANKAVNNLIEERKNNGRYSRKSRTDDRVYRYDVGSEYGRTENRSDINISGRRETTESVDGLHRKEQAGGGFSDTVQSDDVEQAGMDSSERMRFTVAELAHLKSIDDKRYTPEVGGRSSDDAQYSRKTTYSQYSTIAKIWAHETSTQTGDMKDIFNPKTGRFDTIVADDSDEGYYVIKSRVSNDIGKSRIKERKGNGNYSRKSETDRRLYRYDVGSEYGRMEDRIYTDILGRRETTKSIDGLHRKEQAGGGFSDTVQSDDVGRPRLDTSERVRLTVAELADLKSKESKSLTSEEKENFSDDAQYSRKTLYSQYRTVAKIWAHETSTKAGDTKQIYNPKTGRFDTIVADGSDEGYHVIKSYTSNEKSKNRIKKRSSNGNYSRKSETDRRFYRYDAGAENGRAGYRGDSGIFAGRNAAESVDGLYRKESTRGRLTVGYQSDNVGRPRLDTSGSSNLTVAELAYVNDVINNKNFKSETGAIMSERALGNERFIAKLVRSDTSLAEKVINKIKDGIENLRSFETAEKRAEYKFLQKAEGLYLKAIEEAGYKYVGGKIIRPDKDEEEESEAKSEEQKFSKKTVKYIPYDRVGEKTVKAIRNRLSDLYQDVESAVADGFAIESGNVIYVVDSGKENGEIRFGIRRKIAIEDRERRERYIKNINKESAENGFGNRTIFERTGIKLGNDSGSDVGRQHREDLPNDKRKSEDNEGRISSENGDRGVQLLKFSLKSDSRRGNKTVKYIPYDGVGEKTVKAIRNRLSDLYQDVESAVADGIAIESGNTVYIVDSGKDNGEIRFGIRSKIVINDDALRKQRLEIINDRAISKGFVSSELFGQIKRSSGDGGGSGIGRQLQRELSVDSRKSEDNEGRISSENGDRGVYRLNDNHQLSDSRIRYSLKSGAAIKSYNEWDENSEKGGNSGKATISDVDSRGRALSKAQIEYFKNSKVVDNEGRLLPVFHGTDGKFFTFDKALRGNNTDEKDSKLGFFFTSSEEVAEEYATYTKENKLFTVMRIIANDDSSILEKLHTLDEVSRMRGDENIEEYKKLVFKIEDGINDIYEVYLNLVNPLEVDWKGEAYNSEEMFRVINDAIASGNDGVIIKDIDDAVDWVGNLSNTYIAFEPNQIKLTSNNRPTANPDIRFSRKNDKSIVNYAAKALNNESADGVRSYAQNTLKKVYGKSDANEVLKKVSACLEFDDGKYGDISGNKGKITDMLYNALNTKAEGERYKTALDIVDYILSNVALKNIYENDSDDWAITTLDILKPYLHGIKLDSIKEEIRRRYGNNNRVNLLWAAKDGIAPDVVAQSLAEEGIEIDAVNEADIFFKIDELYTDAKATLNGKKKTFIKDVFGEDKLKSLRDEMAKEILRGYDYAGETTAYARMKRKYEDRIESLKSKLSDLADKNTATNAVLDSITKLRKVNKGEFFNATQYKPDIFKATIGRLTAIEYRGNLNKSGTRRLIKNLREWYQPENKMLSVEDGIQDKDLYRSRTAYNEEIGTILDIISNGTGDLSLTELKYLKYAVDYFTTLVSTHNKIYRKGKYVEAKSVAERYVKIAHENRRIVVGWMANKTGYAYTRTFGDPATVVRQMDKYENGFYTETYEELRRGAVNSLVMNMEIRSGLDEFIKKHKGYINAISKEKIKYYVSDDASSAVELTKSNAMSLYLTLKRKQALKGLAQNGFLYAENGKDIRIPGFIGTDAEVSEDTMNSIAAIIKDRLYSQFSAADKQYIEIIEKALNVDCKKAKHDVDIRRQGYSTVLEDYYYPIRRAHIAKNVDGSFFDEVNRVSNASFNQKTVRGAKSELLIEPVSEVADRHIRAISQYACLAEVIDNYNVLFNIDIADNANKPVSVRTETAEIWRRGKSDVFEHRANKYFKQLMGDVQGISAEGNTIWARGLSFIRSGYAKFQLGFNAKVLFSQLSSYIASSGILEYGSLVKGLKISGKDVDKYCPLAKLRNYDRTVIKAQGVIDKVGAVGDVLMKPISAVDRFVIERLFGACRAQVMKDGKGDVGTEENLRAAGELLTEVILETQQNSIATERSAAMRSNNEFMKAITMFSADAMKVIGRVIDSVGEASVLKKRIKLCDSTKRRAELENRLKKVRKKEAKTITALVASAVYMACVAQLFRWLYNRDDENTDVALNMTLDAVGNMFGGLPIIKDLYARLVDGYELDNYAYSVLNDLFDTVDDIFTSAEKIIDGNAEKQDFTSLIKKTFYSVGQLFGIPVRNIYNMTTGIIGHISPSTGYEINAFFYSKNYRSDLKRAIENGDEKMIATIAGLIIDEDVGDIRDSSVRKELNALIKDGYDVLPRSIGKRIEYNGEEYALSKEDIKYVETMYADASESLSNIMKTARYKNASAKVRAKTVKNTYKLTYEMAVADMAGQTSTEKNILFSQVFDVAFLSFILAAVSNLASDKDKNGNVVSGSLKRKIELYLNSLNLTSAQKYIIMGYLGYKNTKGESEVKSYISKYGLNDSEQKALLKYCGY